MTTQKIYTLLYTFPNIYFLYTYNFHTIIYEHTPVQLAHMSIQLPPALGPSIAPQNEPILGLHSD